LRAPKQKKAKPSPKTEICAGLRASATLEAYGNGEIVVRFSGYSIGLGMFGADTAKLAEGLRDGVPIASLMAGKKESGKELLLLVQRLARNGLIEYGLKGAGRVDLVVIEPQAADYWPQLSNLDAADTLVLSRFAYLRRRGNELVLESPRSRALFRLCDPQLAGALAGLATPQKLSVLRRRPDFPGTDLIRLLLDCGILFKVEAADAATLRLAEGDEALALWDFHDLLFHARSTEGRHANPIGGTYPHQGAIAPVPAIRPNWPGKKVELPKAQASILSESLVKLLRRRHSARGFGNAKPITVAELSQLLDATARIISSATPQPGLDDGGHAARPYPSAGGSYELELYLTVGRCDGLEKGFYHYDAQDHALVLIEVPAGALEAVLAGAQSAMGASAEPPIVVTFAARFGRVSWKYSALAYSLILKDVGVLTQTFYLMATEMGLGGCAIGLVNIDLFEKMTGMPFHIEGPVGEFALTRETLST
jgi:SagB-type dehydrogenase family enzyme